MDLAKQMYFPQGEELLPPTISAFGNQINTNGTRWSTHLRQAEHFTFCTPMIGRIWICTKTKIESARLRITFKNYIIRIWIFTKISSIRPCLTPNRPTKFCPNPSITFWDILPTNGQTGGEYITSVHPQSRRWQWLCVRNTCTQRQK